MPVAVRADIVPGAGGSILGYILIITDLTARKEAELTRLQLQQAIFRAQQPAELLAPGAGRGSPEVRALVAAIWANAGVAVSEIADAVTTSSVGPLLREVEARHLLGNVPERRTARCAPRIRGALLRRSPVVPLHRW